MDRIKNVEEKALTRFDRFYRKRREEIIPESKRIDIVLIHPDSKIENGSMSNDEERKNQVRVKLREIFENTLRNDGFVIEETVLKDKVFKKLHCSFRRLCIEAEMTHLQMPLLGLKYPKEGKTYMCSKFIYDKFATDKNDYPKSARFKVKRIHLFDNHRNPFKFFRPAVRTLLVNSILINMNLINDVEIDDIKLLDKDVDWENLTKKNFSADTNLNLALEKKLQKLNFPYMKKIGVYTDNLILHESSEDSKLYEEQPDSTNEETEDVRKENRPFSREDFGEDPRKVLNNEWNTFFKFQPLTKIRDYFGEKIAFYFTWSGLLMTSLWVPMILGLTIFIFGILRSALNATDNSRSTKSLTVFNEACDNEVTPFYALIICVWGTVFLKLWKRKTAKLAYKWAVDGFEITEQERPQFYGTKLREHPATGNQDWYYPKRERLIKFMLSGLILVFILCIVLASVIGVLTYRVFVRVDFCSNPTDQCCVFFTTVVSSLLNSISILILGKVYDWVARRLTDWENHRTQTSYDDALIVKLFAFKFANNYASCIYIAFARGRLGEEGIFGLGEKYTDNCEPNGNCMSELSFQILILTLCKPLPKLFTDFVLVWLKHFWRTLPHCYSERKVEGVQEKNTFVRNEALKPSLGEFTLEEHAEKIIQYGFLMLFAASLPIAPLIALITNLIDKRLDAKRMLWWYRRPLATITQDIGMWYIILQFVNICGVISNGFLIGFTSSWGRKYDVYSRLWIVVGFEHIVFALKLIVDYLVPDESSDVRLMSRKNMHDMSITLRDDREKFEKEYKEYIKGISSNQPPDSPPNKLPEINRKKETKLKIVDEKLVCRPSPKQKRQRVDEQNTFGVVDDSLTLKLKKKRKKRKFHHRQEDRKDD